MRRLRNMSSGSPRPKGFSHSPRRNAEHSSATTQTRLRGGILGPALLDYPQIPICLFKVEGASERPPGAAEGRINVARQPDPQHKREKHDGLVLLSRFFPTGGFRPNEEEG